ncbi:MAG: molybdate ABC transporter substrate-binding protein [Lentisphaerales bacterium]|nr:molybdate ABC transporter substrate-binding protein [Lentisphaerales bacterium]
MNKAIYIFGGFIVVMLVAVGFLFTDNQAEDGEATQGLDFYCAAGMKLPVEAVVKDYEREFGVKINIIYGGSGTLLNNLEVAQKGDLYLAADFSYITIAREKGLVAEAIPVNQLRAGLAVAKGNPHKVKSLQDLIDNPKLKIGLANPDAASIGKFTKNVLSKHKFWDAIEKRVKADGVFTGTVNELTNNLKLSSIDVGIVWDAVAAQYPELEFIHVPEFDSKAKNTTIGILKSTENSVRTLHFARYLSAKDKGLIHFKNMGFSIVDGDKWANKPEINFFGGGMLRPAVEQSIREFEQREGVSISTTFNGCGILVSQMNAGAKPDAYFACDTEFMDLVQDRFGPATDVTKNDIVIAVAKGNPKGIKTLSDLTKPGMKVGLGHPDKSALGYLTKQMLVKVGLHDKIKKNVTVDSPTGDFLVNKINLHSVDAVIIYRSNFQASPTAAEECEMVLITETDATAVQPYAFAKNNEHKELLTRLMKHITQNQKRFLKLGFHWQGALNE